MLQTVADVFDLARREYVAPLDERRLFEAALQGMAQVEGVTPPSAPSAPFPPPTAAGEKALASQFGDALSQIEQRSGRRPDRRLLMEAAIRQMLKMGAPGSSYLSASEFQDVRATTRGQTGGFGSIGATLGAQDDLPRIDSANPDGPARRAGLEPGDLLLEINGASLADVDPQEAMQRLRGPVGAIVDLKVRRGADVFRRMVVREAVANAPLQTRVVDGVGVMRQAAFGESPNSWQELEAFFLANPDLKGAVLDLRGSPGGLLDMVIAFADELLDGGEVVVVRGRDPKSTERYNARRGELLKGRPLVVLIDQNTSSGAEILAAALQDRRRAKVVGLPSFGAGTIDTVIPLRGGQQGAVRLLTTFAYRPSGAPLEKVGVTPDVVVAQSAAEAERARSADGFFSETQRSPDIDVPGVKPRAKPAAVEAPPPGFSGDYQMQRALELVRSMIR
jgi:carboxyl-terminal processing protease